VGSVGKQKGGSGFFSWVEATVFLHLESKLSGITKINLEVS